MATLCISSKQGVLCGRLTCHCTPKEDHLLSGAQKCISGVICLLKLLRSETQFKEIWKDTSVLAEELNIPPPPLPWRHKPPRHIDEGSQPHQFTDAMSYYTAQAWIALLDMIIAQIKNRFSINSFLHICHSEDWLIPATTGRSYKNELQKFMTFYEDFDDSSLQA